MRIYRSIFVALLLMHISLGIYSQNGYGHYKDLQNQLGRIANTLMYNLVQYTQPENFDLFVQKSDDEEYLTFLRSDKYTRYEPGVWNKLISKDKNFITFIYVPPIYSKDSIYVYMPLAPDIWYRDPKEYIEFVDPSEDFSGDSIIIISGSNKKTLTR